MKTKRLQRYSTWIPKEAIKLKEPKGKLFHHVWYLHLTNQMVLLPTMEYFTKSQILHPATWGLEYHFLLKCTITVISEVPTNHILTLTQFHTVVPGTIVF